MKDKVLILGAGMVVQPIVDYLLHRGITVTLASRTVEKVQKAIGKHKKGYAVQWNVDDLETLEKLIRTHDLVVSLLPYVHHMKVAEICIRLQTDMVTTSYVSDQMNALDEKARKAGIILLNEIGVDPGYDHMTAMKIIDKTHAGGAKIEEFYSLCGALVAPEARDNPFNYKFSWSPKGVVMAGNNDARYLKDGRHVYIPSEDLFKNPLEIDFPGVGPLQVYPNRNSLSYIDLYDIPEVKTMYRGTFRYPNWCETFDLMKALGLTKMDEYDARDKTYHLLTAEFAGLKPGSDLRKYIQQKYDLPPEAPAIRAMEWLGLFSEEQSGRQKVTPFDLISDLMVEKMMLKPGERDMVVMQHIFKVKNGDGSGTKITSRMLDFGDQNYTSIARTVALPAAIATKLILEGTICVKGVQIPVISEIYNPVLGELEALGIKMEEKQEIITE